MIISTATLALLRGDATPELADAPGRVIKPMGEIKRPKEYKQRKPLPVSSEPAEPQPAEPMPGVDMDAVHSSGMMVIQATNPKGLRSKPVSPKMAEAIQGDRPTEPLPSLVHPRIRIAALGVCSYEQLDKDYAEVNYGPTIKELIYNGLLADPEQPKIEFTNLDVQRYFDLTDTEAFNFTQALVERGFLTRDLMQDADGRVFYLFSTGRNHVV